jgi:hypothetical protein
MRKAVVVLAALSALVLVGCQQQTVGDAKTQFCTDLKAVNTAVDGVKALGPTSTIEQTQQATKTLEDSWTTLKASAANLKEVQLQATEDAFNQITTAMKGVSDQATLAQAATGIQAGTAAFDVAYKAINTTVCGVVAP